MRLKKILINYGGRRQGILLTILMRSRFILILISIIFILLYFKSLYAEEVENLVAKVRDSGGYVYAYKNQSQGEWIRVMPGMQLDVLEQRESWIGVRLPSGNGGWIEKNYVEIFKSHKNLGPANHQGILKTAYQFFGYPYVRGGTSPEVGFDCSGFVYYVFAKNGIRLPRKSSLQFKEGIPIHKDDIMPGDLVFFANSLKEVTHIGIYWNAGYFIHSSSAAGGVVFTSLSEDYYKKRFVGVRRIWW